MASQNLTQLILESQNFKKPIAQIFAFNPLKANEHKPPADFKPKASLVLPEQHFGVEVEIENVLTSMPSALNKFWHSTEDGSLRNNGAEFISFPMKGDQALYALDGLYKYLNKIGATCSPRTSVHVHINMQNYTMEHFWNILMLYLVFERVLYDFVGNERERNNFCIPLYAYPRTYDFLFNFAIDPKAACTHWLKYTGLNLRPITNTHSKSGYGTIEFRHFSGSKDYDTVVLWINLILSLVKTATQYKYHDLERTINTVGVNFLTELVFKEYSGVFASKPLQLMISEGIRDYKLFSTLRSNHSFNESSDLYKALNK